VFEYDETKVAHTDFVRAVERRMDEVAGDGETPRVQAAKVYSFGAEAVRQLLRTGPRLLLAPLALRYTGQGGGGAFVPALTAIGDPASRSETPPTIGYRVSLPFASEERFLRFVRLKLAGWPRAVEAAEPTGTVAHAREADPYQRPAGWRPRVYLHARGHPADGASRQRSAFELEAYPKGEGTLDELVVLAERRPDTAVAAAPELADALYWATAARVLRAERYAELADAAETAARAALEGQRLGLAGEPDVSPNPSLS